RLLSALRGSARVNQAIFPRELGLSQQHLRFRLQEIRTRAADVYTVESDDHRAATYCLAGGHRDARDAAGDLRANARHAAGNEVYRTRYRQTRTARNTLHVTTAQLGARERARRKGHP